jgi:hypothetical protein
VAQERPCVPCVEVRGGAQHLGIQQMSWWTAGSGDAKTPALGLQWRITACYFLLLPYMYCCTAHLRIPPICQGWPSSKDRSTEVPVLWLIRDCTMCLTADRAFRTPVSDIPLPLQAWCIWWDPSTRIAVQEACMFRTLTSNWEFGVKALRLVSLMVLIWVKSGARGW